MRELAASQTRFFSCSIIRRGLRKAKTTLENGVFFLDQESVISRTLNSFVVWLHFSVIQSWGGKGSSPVFYLIQPMDHLVLLN